jgi:hypothetical protein
MNGRVVMYLLMPVIAVLLIPLCLRLVNGPAFRQKPDEVVIREPGERFLGKPRPATSEAKEDLDFALLSQAAYQREANSGKVEATDCPGADTLLEAAGWSPWKDFPNQDLQKEVDEVHLRVEVWSNSTRKAVAVAFGGTVFRNLKDWKSDLRWFVPKKHDEYTVIVETFGHEFVNEYLRRENMSEWAFLSQADVFSTGHSLGGGLAQEFAYSLPTDANVPRVKKVYAFDPSPVTGFFSVEEGLRNRNKENLAIDRIYERGEILSILRSFTHFVAPPASLSPTIRQVRCSLFYTMNPFAGHSIAELACKLREACQK